MYHQRGEQILKVQSYEYVTCVKELQNWTGTEMLHRTC